MLDTKATGVTVEPEAIGVVEKECDPGFFSVHEALKAGEKETREPLQTSRVCDSKSPQKRSRRKRN